MKQVLILEASPRGSESASRKVSATFRKKLRAQYPEAKIVVRDLVADPLPSLDEAALNAFVTNNASTSETAKLSDQLTEELLASDLLVIATPMWNFGVPPTVKAWLDLVVRAGKTFKFSDHGAEGLAKGTVAVLIISSGGVFSDGPWKAWDFVDPYLRLVLKFIGINDIQTIRAEGLNIPTLSANSVLNAESAVEKLVL